MLRTYSTALFALALSIAAPLASPPAQSVQLIKEYFNYGQSRMRLKTCNGGRGWLARWQNNGDFFPANQTPSVTPGYYDPRGNLPTSGGGGQATTGGKPGAQRSFAKKLTGEVWVSFLVAPDNTRYHLCALTFNGLNQGGFGINNHPNNRAVVVAWASGPNGQTRGTRKIKRGKDILVIAKLLIDNAPKKNEFITLWVNPNFTATTVKGLGTPDIAAWNMGDFQKPWQWLFLLLGYNNGIDAIRIAHGSGSTQAKLMAVLKGDSLRPGSSNDFSLLTGIGTAPPTAFPDSKTIAPGGRVTVLMKSPFSSFVGKPVLLAAIPAGSATPFGHFGVYLGAGSAFLLQPTSWFMPILGAGGTHLTLIVPSATPRGLDILLQAYVINGRPPLGIEASDAHEIRIR